MHVLWEANDWLKVRDIRERMDFKPVSYTTVAKVTSILYDKGLLLRPLGHREGNPGPSAWWYRAAQPIDQDIGQLIAALLELSPDPEAKLGYARPPPACPRP